MKAYVAASAKSWAAILSRVFEVDPLIWLTHLGLPLDWPKTVPARSRPPPEEPAPGEESQANPLADLYDGKV